jgi:hypothetical protein
MEHSAETHATLTQRARHELLQYFYVSAYLYVCFGAILLYKTAILRGAGIEADFFGLALVKALILGKFILIGDAFKIGGRVTRGRLVFDILYKSAVFLVLLLILSVIEEAFVALFHGHPIREAVPRVAGGTLLQVFATSLLMLLILIPYFAFREIALGLGEGTLRKLLIERRLPDTQTGVPV